jgi:hypothetical protein
MSVSLSFRRLGFALGALLLVALVACKGSSKGGESTPKTVAITGTVTYDRVPTLRDAAGLPLGLETDTTKFERNILARNLRVNLYRKYAIADPAFPNDRTKDKIFFGLWGFAKTTKEGVYNFGGLPVDQEWMVEVQSSIQDANATMGTVNLLADPAGMASTVPQQNRLRYCLRKAPDGTAAPTAPGVNHVATSLVPSTTTTTTLNFHIDENTAWFLSDNDFDHQEGRIVSNMVPGYSPGVVDGSNLNGYDGAGSLEAVATGSKVIAILDAFMDVATYPGYAASGAVGPAATLDIHYLQGHSEAKGTYLEWDRSTYPQGERINPATGLPVPTGLSSAVDPYSGEVHYFGSVRGAAANDDAWDRGQILLLAARAHTFLQLAVGAYYHQATPFQQVMPLPRSVLRSNLEPQMALLEGIPYGLAAVIQKNPYLADTSAGPVTYVDVRDLSGVPAADRTAFSAPFCAALIWELGLGAKGITRPGTPTTWANIVPAGVLPFCTLRDYADYLEPLSFYTQLKAMQAPLGGLNGSSATVTSPFTDSAIQTLLTNLGAPTGNIPWPRPATGPLALLATPWGDNPSSVPAPPASSPILPFQLSMAQAVPVSGVYDNTSFGELKYAYFTIQPTRAYLMSVELPGGALTNGRVEVSFIGTRTPDGQVLSTYTFSTSTTTPIPLTLQSLPSTSSYWIVRVRMLSPTTLQPDTTVKVSLVPAI